MKKILLTTAALIATSALAVPACATVHMVFNPGGSVSALGMTVINAFEVDSGISGSGYKIKGPVSDGEGAVIPTSVPTHTNYLSILGGGTANIVLPTGTSAFAFDWGSLDSYNKLTVTLTGGKTFDAIPGVTFTNTWANGNQQQNPTNGVFRVHGDAGETFQKLSFHSRGNSLEIDNLAVTAPVPEASTWALMLVGLGAVGSTMRRRKVAVSFA